MLKEDKRLQDSHWRFSYPMYSNIFQQRPQEQQQQQQQMISGDGNLHTALASNSQDPTGQAQTCAQNKGIKESRS